MGNFYVNFSVKGVSQDQLLHDLQVGGFDAFVGPAENGYCCFTEKAADQQDQAAIERVAALLSKRTGKPIVAVMNHDDDLLSVDLFAGGSLVAEYNSCPGHFESEPSEESLRPRLSNGEAFSKLLSHETFTTLQKAFIPAEGEYPPADELHDRIAVALGLPRYVVGFGFRYALRGEFPPASGAFVRVPG